MYKRSGRKFNNPSSFIRQMQKLGLIDFRMQLLFFFSFFFIVAKEKIPWLYNFYDSLVKVVALSCFIRFTPTFQRNQFREFIVAAEALESSGIMRFAFTIFLLPSLHAFLLSAPKKCLRKIYIHVQFLNSFNRTI